MNKKMLIIILSCLVIALVIAVYAINAVQSNIIHIPDAKLVRILPDPVPNRYWVVDKFSGLILLSQPQPPDGPWDWQKYPIGPVIDAAGPDSQGRLYCSFSDYKTIKGVHIFDCASASVIDTIDLDYLPRALALSSDEARLYVVAYGWPSFGQFPDESLADMHPDSGLLLEIDIATKAVLRSAATGALPETVHYIKCGEVERVLVGTGEGHTVSEPGEFGYACGKSAPVDIFDISTLTRLEPRIYVQYGWSSYRNAMLDWTFNGCYVAICCYFPFRAPDRPEMDDAIWIIDPVTNSVVDTFTIRDLEGNVVGAQSAIISSVHEDRVYVAMGMTHQATVNPGPWDRIYIIDPYSGETLDAIDTEWQASVFIFEIPDGRLLVSCDKSGDILVLDPDN